MARWGLMVHRAEAGNEPNLVEMLDEIEGTREQAEARLWDLLGTYQPRHPRMPKRRRIYRTADGWLLVGEGSFGKCYPYHFQACELVWDSEAK